jgi:multicomponent Na+:H+ antiporter subunit E
MLAAFFIAWIIFNGRITMEILLFGAVISTVMFYFICKYMNYNPQKEKNFYRNILPFCGYLFLLIKEIIIANIAVFRLILNGNEVVEPIIVRIKPDLKSEFLRVVLANSITLTPGTITVSISEEELVVHCLDKSLAEGMEQSQFVKMLQRMERGGQEHGIDL